MGDRAFRVLRLRWVGNANSPGNRRCCKSISGRGTDIPGGGGSPQITAAPLLSRATNSGLRKCVLQHSTCTVPEVPALQQRQAAPIGRHRVAEVSRNAVELASQRLHAELFFILGRSQVLDWIVSKTPVCECVRCVLRAHVQCDLRFGLSQPRVDRLGSSRDYRSRNPAGPPSADGRGISQGAVHPRIGCAKAENRWVIPDYTGLRGTYNHRYINVLRTCTCDDVRRVGCLRRERRAQMHWRGVVAVSHGIGAAAQRFGGAGHTVLGLRGRLPAPA